MSPGNEYHEIELWRSKAIPIWYDRFEDFLAFTFPVVGVSAKITFVSQSGDFL